MIGRPLRLLAALGVVAMLAPWLAPYGAVQRFDDLLLAPPMPVHVDAAGLYTHPLQVRDRLAREFAVDTGRRTGLPWTTPVEVAPVLLLGADSLGRDVLSRLLHGARASLGLALIATLGSLVAGALLGAWAGAAGGLVERVVLRLGDVLIVLPMLYVIVAIRAALPLVLPLSAVTAVLAVIFVALGWPRIARGVWAIVRVEAREEHVFAAIAAGASRWRVMTRHLLPACAGFLAVQAALLVPGFVLAEATLSYVGLGFPDHVPSWGTALSESANVGAMTRAPWTLAPAAAIFLVVLTTNVLLEPSRADAAAPPTR